MELERGNLMNINELRDSWISAGAKVQDLLEKKNALQAKYNEDPESVTVDDMKNAQADYKKAVEARNFAKQNYEDAKSALEVENAKPVPVAKEVTPESITDKFVKDFTNMVTSGTTGAGNAGLTIPQDIQTAIHQLIRSFNPLQNFVNVENVSTKSGSRVYEKLSDITPMQELDDESGTIQKNDDSQLTTINYLIHRYAGISEITNTLLKDTAENIMAWLTNWVAKKVVVTRNSKILEAMGKASKKPTISTFDDIKDLENNTLDPLINSTSSFVTNQSGFNLLSKVKDAEGRYMIQPNVTNPEVKEIGGHTVTVIADKFLPDVSGSHPIYFGDLKQGITLYDRQNMQIDTSNVAGDAFERDITKIRVIDRFDVEVIDDGAWAVGSFKTVANQTAQTTSTPGK